MRGGRGSSGCVRQRLCGGEAAESRPCLRQLRLLVARGRRGTLEGASAKTGSTWAAPVGRGPMRNRNYLSFSLRLAPAARGASAQCGHRRSRSAASFPLPA